MINRYRVYGQLDDTPVNDGDSYWTGFKSRFQPTYLKDGEAYYSGNLRMDRGTCKVRKGLKALSNDINLNNPPLIAGAFSLAVSVAVNSITRAVNTATVTTATNHGYTSGDRVNMRGAVETDYNGDFTIAVTGLTTFTYTVANTPATPATGTIFANKGPRVYNVYSSAALASGDYADSTTNTEGIVICAATQAYIYRYGQATIDLTYPANETVATTDNCCLVQFLNKIYFFRGYSTAATLTVSTLSQAGGTATCTTSTAHGLSSNSWVTMFGASPDGYNGIVQITNTGALTFTYTVDASIATLATGTITARPCKPPLYWDLNTTTHAFQVVPTGPNAAGAPLIDMPAADWGMYFISRMVIPFSRDQFVMSDVLDAETYDPSQTQFRILPGTNDWIIAAFPYQLSRLLVLYRKSVHSVYLDSATLTVAGAYEVTRNFGCVSRRSVANCGPSILWLSDLGVVQMSVNSELSLQNTSAPLSDPIQDIISTINWSYAGNAVAVFWNNRYYLAAPTGTSTVNNTILVYNFLNSQWESVDTYPGGFDVLNFHIISYNGTKRIHAVGSAGYVSLMEENEFDEFGAPGSELDYTITGSLKTRNYLAQTYDLKKVKRYQLEANLGPGESFTTNYVLSNPDYTLAEPAQSASTTDTDSGYTFRQTVNRRGVSSRLEITTTGGRPEFKAVVIEASIGNRATLTYP
jgi:hypothetical protein